MLAVMPGAGQSNGGRDFILAYLRHRSHSGVVGVSRQAPSPAGVKRRMLIQWERPRIGQDTRASRVPPSREATCRSPENNRRAVRGFQIARHGRGRVGEGVSGKSARPDGRSLMGIRFHRRFFRPHLTLAPLLS
jgi:hypothetical protein